VYRLAPYWIIAKVCKDTVRRTTSDAHVKGTFVVDWMNSTPEKKETFSSKLLAVRERAVGSKDISDDLRKIEAPHGKTGARLKK